jgi:hypothetical protein
MAILIRGTTVCRICFRVIESGQAVVTFTDFVPNELDPLHFFNDRAFHAHCYESHRLSAEALRRLTELLERNGPGHRFCEVCKQPILHADEYFSLGHLTDDHQQLVFVYNYLQFHRRCLSNWSSLSDAYEALLSLRRSGTWRGKNLELMLGELAAGKITESKLGHSSKPQ